MPFTRREARCVLNNSLINSHPSLRELFLIIRNVSSFESFRRKTFGLICKYYKTNVFRITRLVSSFNIFNMVSCAFLASGRAVPRYLAADPQTMASRPSEGISNRRRRHCKFAFAGIGRALHAKFHPQPQP